MIYEEIDYILAFSDIANDILWNEIEMRIYKDPNNSIFAELGKGEFISKSTSGSRSIRSQYILIRRLNISVNCDDKDLTRTCLVTAIVSGEDLKMNNF